MRKFIKFGLRKLTRFDNREKINHKKYQCPELSKFYDQPLSVTQGKKKHTFLKGV